MTEGISQRCTTRATEVVGRIGNVKVAGHAESSAEPPPTSVAPLDSVSHMTRMGPLLAETGTSGCGDRTRWQQEAIYLTADLRLPGGGTPVAPSTVAGFGRGIEAVEVR